MTDQTLAQWVQTVCRATGIDPAAVDVIAILDLAKDAAHGVARPAAPLTTFMAGYLAGQAASSADAASSPDAAAVTRAVLAEIGTLIPPPSL